MIINKDMLFLIHGKKTGTNELLMIPVYNPSVGEYLSTKLIQEGYYDEIKVETPDNKIIMQK